MTDLLDRSDGANGPDPADGGDGAGGAAGGTGSGAGSATGSDTDSGLGARKLSREERAALAVAQSRTRRLIAGIVIGALVLVAAVGGYVIWGTSVLGLKDIVVTADAGDLDPAVDVAVEAAVGVSPGTPLITVDLAEVRRRVEAVPTVADAAVSRHWPGTLRVVVTPRTPVAVVAANSALYLLDASGLPYTTVAAKPAELVNLRLATPGPGDPATMAGLTVIQALPASMVTQIASVTAAGPYDITIELTDGRTVFWGGPNDNARKALVLPAALTRDGTSFDISDPELITAR